jgi:antitoxin component YwqK of YwqJK toxin-antitoxin module
MRRTLVFLLFGFLANLVSGQNFKIYIHNSSFTTCSDDQANIERMVISEPGMTDKYFKDKQPFTGCAQTTLVNRNGLAIEYVVAEIVDGYPVKTMYYFEDGSISREFNFKDGKSHGLHIMYYENGGKYIEEMYENGRPHGPTKRWTKEGKLARDAFFQGGMPIFDIVYVKDDRC